MLRIYKYGLLTFFLVILQGCVAATVVSVAAGTVKLGVGVAGAAAGVVVDVVTEDEEEKKKKEKEQEKKKSGF